MLAIWKEEIWKNRTMKTMQRKRKKKHDGQNSYIKQSNKQMIWGNGMFINMIEFTQA